MWVMWVYIVWVEIVCIRYDKIAKQNVSQVSRGLPMNTHKNQLSPSPFVMTLHIPVMYWAHASLRRKATHELPARTSLVFNCLESSHSLSHTTLTKKFHIKYRYIRLNKITIKFDTELKPIQNSCKSQLYTLGKHQSRSHPFWNQTSKPNLFKAPKVNINSLFSIANVQKLRLYENKWLFTNRCHEVPNTILTRNQTSELKN